MLTFCSCLLTEDEISAANWRIWIEKATLDRADVFCLEANVERHCQHCQKKIHRIHSHHSLTASVPSQKRLQIFDRERFSPLMTPASWTNMLWAMENAEISVAVMKEQSRRHAGWMTDELSKFRKANCLSPQNRGGIRNDKRKQKELAEVEEKREERIRRKGAGLLIKFSDKRATKHEWRKLYSKHKYWRSQLGDLLPKTPRVL